MSGSEPAGGRPSTISAYIAAELRARIAAGELPPGARLRQSRIAKEFDVSLTPVREALYHLDAQGLVHLDQYRGAVVFEPTETELRNCYAVRSILESAAVRQISMESIPPERLDRAEALANEMDSCEEPSKWTKLNAEFHGEIYALTNNPILVSTIDRLRALSEPYIRLYVADVDRRRPNDDHRALVEALRTGSAVKAAEVTLRHLAATEEGVIGRIRGPENSSDNATAEGGNPEV